MHISYVLLACLASSVSCDLAALLRFAQGGPPPVASARQIGGVKLDSVLRDLDKQTPSATPQHNDNQFFPLGSKLVKRVEQPTNVPVKSVETPVSVPEHSKLLKNNLENQHRLELERTKSETELKMDLVRIPKPKKSAQQTGPKSLPDDSNVARTSELQADSQVPPVHPKLQPSSVPTNPRIADRISPRQPAAFPSPPLAENIRLLPPETHAFSPDAHSLPQAPEHQQFQQKGSLNEDPRADTINAQESDQGLESALNLIRTNWDFIKSGGRLILNHEDDDPIFISKEI